MKKFLFRIILFLILLIIIYYIITTIIGLLIFFVFFDIEILLTAWKFWIKPDANFLNYFIKVIGIFFSFLFSISIFFALIECKEI